MPPHGLPVIGLAEGGDATDAADRIDWRAVIVVGPFGLCRLTSETGGLYFTVHPTRKVGGTARSWETAAYSSRLEAFFDAEGLDPDALFVCTRMAKTIAARRTDAKKGYGSRDFAELHAVLWHLTDDEKYKQLGLEGGEKPLKIVTGGMKQPANAHWLLTRPPRKKK